MSPLGRKLLRDLSAARWQFAALTLVLVLGIASFGALYNGAASLDRSEEDTYETLKFADVTLSVTDAPSDVVRTLEGTAGISAVSGRLTQDVPLVKPHTRGDLVTARVISVPAPDRPAVNDLLVEEGSYLQGAGGALVDKEFAGVYDLHPGDQVQIVANGEKRAIRVEGVVTSPEYLWMVRSNLDWTVPKGSFGVLFVAQQTAEDLLDRPGQIDEVALLLDDGADSAQVMARVEEALAPYGIAGVVTREEQPSHAAIRIDLEGLGTMATVFPVFFLLVTAIMTYILLSRVVEAQRTQIGLMRAEGYSERQVMRHYLGFAVVIGLTGSVLGTLLGLLLGNVLTGWYASIVNIPLAKFSPAWWTLGLGIVLGLVCCAAAGVIPARSASRLPPAEAMRPATPPAGRIRLLESALPFLAKSPNVLKIPVRNLFRTPRRTLYTVVGVAFAAAIILSALAIMDAVRATMHLQFDEIQAYDLKVSLAEPSDDVAVRLGAVDGVEEVEPIVETSCRLSHGDEEYSTVIMGLPEDGELYRLFPASGGAQLQNGGILLGDKLGKRLGVGRGEIVRVQTAGGIVEARVAAFVKSPVGSLAYTSLENAQRMLGLGSSASGALLRVREGGLEAAKQRLFDVPSVASVDDRAEMKKSYSDVIVFYYEFIGVLLVFGGALAFAIVLNTVTVNIMERRREIATALTLGASLKMMAAMVTLENLLMGIGGVVLGIALGYGISSQYVIRANENDLLSLEFAIYGTTYVLSVMAVLGIMLLSQLPGLRHLARLDLAKVTKEQSR